MVGGRLLLLFCLLLVNLKVFAVVSIESVRASHVGTHTRLVFDCKGSPHQHLAHQHQPERVVLTLPNATWPGKGVAKLKTGVIGAIHATERANRLVVSIDLTQRARHDLFVLPATAKHKSTRLVLDLRARPGATKNAKVKLTPKARKQVVDDGDTSRPVVVVVDPGHGGKDPGATGLWGTREKDVALGIARSFKQVIDAKPGMRAYLTRNSDVFLTLRERLGRARRRHADLFISIHADAFEKRSAAGASVYALSENGASNEAARWLASHENHQALMGGVGLADKGQVLKGVLLDLSQTSTTAASLDVGARLLAQLKGVTHLHRDQVDQAAFVVLKSPDIPSVLVETGFLSNPKEEARLRSQAHQRHFAEAMARGLEAYFNAHPPRGSYFAWQLQHAVRHHVVRSGETLGGIALRYHCALKALKARNGGVGDHLSVGQDLVIPHCV